MELCCIYKFSAHKIILLKISASGLFENFFRIIIGGWALINVFYLKGGHLFEVGRFIE